MLHSLIELHSRTHTPLLHRRIYIPAKLAKTIKLVQNEVKLGGDEV